MPFRLLRPADCRPASWPVNPSGSIFLQKLGRSLEMIRPAMRVDRRDTAADLICVTRRLQLRRFGRALRSVGRLLLRTLCRDAERSQVRVSVAAMMWTRRSRATTLVAVSDRSHSPHSTRARHPPGRRTIGAVSLVISTITTV